MGLFKKKEQAEKEPQYYLSAINTEVVNYNVYYLSKKENIILSIVLFILGAGVGYLFYGGIGKDPNGHPTVLTYILNTVIMAAVGFAALKAFKPAYAKRKISKRKDKLRVQFIDLLDSLATSIASGKNVPQAFASAKSDMMLQYNDDDYIINELNVIIIGIENNVAVEDMLIDLGIRSGIADISNFGYVFQTVYRKGGNIKEAISSCHDLLTEKIEIELAISTKIASAKNEQNVMMVMPIGLVAMVKMMGSDFAENFTTPLGIVSTTVAVALFVASYFVGRKLIKIEV